MAIGFFSRSSFRSIILTCLTASVAGGCAPDEGTTTEQAQGVVTVCPPLPANVAFFDSFENGLGQWKVDSTTPLGDGHSWAVDTTPPVYAGNAQLRSDTAGMTALQHGAHIQSVAFSLAGKKHSRLQFQARYSLACNDIFAVYVTNGTFSAQLAELQGSNASYPGFDPVSVDLSAFDGSPAVFLSFYLNTGNSGTGYGVALDNVEVSSDPGSLPSNVAFMETWQNGLSAWKDQSSPVTGAGHRWTVMPVLQNPSICAVNSLEARSDPAGMTQPGTHARILSPPFSLAGVSQAKLLVRANYKLGGNDYFAITATDGNFTAEVAELHHTNPSFPASDVAVVDLKYFVGKPKVYLTLDLLASTVDFGAAVESLEVVTQ